MTQIMRMKHSRVAIAAFPSDNRIPTTSCRGKNAHVRRQAQRCDARGKRITRRPSESCRGFTTDGRQVVQDDRAATIGLALDGRVQILERQRAVVGDSRLHTASDHPVDEPAVYKIGRSDNLSCHAAFPYTSGRRSYRDTPLACSRRRTFSAGTRLSVHWRTASTVTPNIFATAARPPALSIATWV